MVQSIYRNTSRMPCYKVKFKYCIRKRLTLLLALKSASNIIFLNKCKLVDNVTGNKFATIQPAKFFYALKHLFSHQLNS